MVNLHIYEVFWGMGDTFNANVDVIGDNFDNPCTLCVWFFKGGPMVAEW